MQYGLVCCILQWHGIVLCIIVQRRKSTGGRLLCASIEGPSLTVTCSIVSYSTVQDSSKRAHLLCASIEDSNISALMYM